MTANRFIIDRPAFNQNTGVATLTYRLDDLRFTETLGFPEGFDAKAAESTSFKKLLDLTACVLGVSYYKLGAPFAIEAPEIALRDNELHFLRDVYENGLGEFYARNNLQRFGKLEFTTRDDKTPIAAPHLEKRLLLPIGGGKDSLVSVQLLELAGTDFTPFAVNPKGPILTSVDAIEKTGLFISRTLDPEMIRLGKEPGYYNGHVPSTAINSMIAALTALLFGYDTIALSNERSASEGNVEFDGREANHQHSKSIGFERLIADTLRRATHNALKYFSLLRPFSEAKIARLFARETKFDTVFSSCNRNFRLTGNDGALWCGECPKCHFTYLILAPEMAKARLTRIFGQNLLGNSAHELAFRELTGLAGQKPWECVGEILEAAACLWQLGKWQNWQSDAVVKALLPDLEKQYGADALEAAYQALHADSTEHLVPDTLAEKVMPHAL